jgi:hypothetical protein
MDVLMNSDAYIKQAEKYNENRAKLWRIVRLSIVVLGLGYFAWQSLNQGDVDKQQALEAELNLYFSEPQKVIPFLILNSAKFSSLPSKQQELNAVMLQNTRFKIRDFFREDNQEKAAIEANVPDISRMYFLAMMMVATQFAKDKKANTNFDAETINFIRTEIANGRFDTNLYKFTAAVDKSDANWVIDSKNLLQELDALIYVRK